MCYANLYCYHDNVYINPLDKMIELIPLVIILAFIFETMDSCAGMGFGTGLTPLLFLLGYEPLQVVPILLISETITGFTAGFFRSSRLILLFLGITNRSLM